MTRALAILAGLGALIVFSQAPTETYRPLFHFSPAKNWTNDPNGLVYDGSEYHLFFQFNPFGDQWGHMSWGHAVSKDLNGWRELPVALAEENGVMIFSGSAVVDARNTSGFGKEGAAPLVAIYTGHGHGLQTQNIAYSTDHGRTWTKFAGNPVIDIHAAEFRDPMVFWHEASRRWIMVVSLAPARKVRFYASSDLKKWERLSEFGPAGARGVPNWECPSFFELPVANVKGESRWVLVVGVGDHAAAGGSGTEYFVGRFDGERFVNENAADEVLWVDRGADFYAAQTWSGVPDGRRILLGWMANWKYAAKLPTSPWRGQMTYPRSLELEKDAEGIRLVQNPVREIERLREGRVTREWSEALDIVAELRTGASRDTGIELRQGPEHGTRVGYDAAKGVVYIDRTRSGALTIHPEFAARHEAPLRLRDGVLRLRILLDRCSVEVFADGGRVAMTDLIFPEPGDRGLSVYGAASIDVWSLKPTSRP